MGDQDGAGTTQDAPPSAPRALLFILAAAGYYVVYYVFFAMRVGEYFRDLLLHFSFFRKLF